MGAIQQRRWSWIGNPIDSLRIRNDCGLCPGLKGSRKWGNPNTLGGLLVAQQFLLFPLETGTPELSEKSARRPRAFRSSRVVVFLKRFSRGSGLEWPEKALAKVTALQLYATLLCPCRGGPAERLTKVRAAPFTLKGFLQIQRASCTMATTDERVRARSVKALAAFCWCVPTRRRRPGLELIVLGSSTRSNRSSNDENNRSTAMASIATWRI